MHTTPALSSPIGAVELFEPLSPSSRSDAPQAPALVTWIKGLFGQRDATTVLHEQHFEARRLAVEHAQAAEYHSALADMYARQSLRVGSLLDEVA